MPEGPELKILSDSLQYLVNSKIVQLKILSGRYSKPDKAPPLFSQLNQQFPLTISEINVKGKLLYFKLEKDWILLNTMGMSGRWTTNYQKHCHLELLLDNQQKIWFCDPRCFGTIKILTKPKQLEKKLSSLGPDILNSTIEDQDFITIMRKHANKNITKVLMTQSIISGCGNYIKSEALYRARISPHNLVKDIDDDRLITLSQQLQQIANESYLSQGASISTYYNLDDSKGNFTFEFQVYGRKYDNDNNLIKREKTLDGRTSHWVPNIQY